MRVREQQRKREGGIQGNTIGRKGQRLDEREG
jgi:hypothetical protein